MRYRKKPVVIDAIQYLGNISDGALFHIEPQADDFSWLADGEIPPQQDRPPEGQWFYVPGTETLRIGTLEGEHLATKGDWIIRGVAGEIYPIKPDIFAATYEPA